MSILMPHHRTMRPEPAIGAARKEEPAILIFVAAQPCRDFAGSLGVQQPSPTREGQLHICWVDRGEPPPEASSPLSTVESRQR